MADSATLVGLLDKADNVFVLAGDIGVALVREQSYRSDNPPPTQADWRQRQEWLIEAGRNLDQLQTSLRELHDAIQRPPGGFEGVAEQLREATKLVLHCYQDGGVEIVRILGTWFLFHEVSEAGRKIVSEMCRAVRREGLAAILREPMSAPPRIDGAGDRLPEGEMANAAGGQAIAAANATGGASVPTPKAKKKKRGRPPREYATIRKEREIMLRWNNRQKGVTASEFAESNDIGEEEFARLRNRCQRAESRSKKAK